LVARLGGDEFAILVSKRNLPRITALADRIVAVLAKPFNLNGHDVVIGTSIGIACAPDHGENGERLLQNADLALYTAKAQGRNRAAMFERGMDEAAHARRLLELDLRGSLGKDEMRLHYQPVVDVQSGQVTGYEALIRWEHPERGIVMPNLFIPVAEETGMIVQIGEWVIRQALDDLAAWDDHLSVAINLSPAQMRCPSLVTTVINALASSGVDPARVCFEITETVLMQDSEVNIETLHKLNGLGLQIALDDFGTGYSSLNYLRSFPFNKIKIDRCFVDDIDTREDCQAIVRSVVALANSLGMTTTAEGVERSGQLDRLRLEGCGEVQGFLYSKAVPAHELTDLRMPVRPAVANVARIDAALSRREWPASRDAAAQFPRQITAPSNKRRALR
jgi:predicted signal transduction protein with EAL and GGDEF domain